MDDFKVFYDEKEDFFTLQKRVKKQRLWKYPRV